MPLVIPPGFAEIALFLSFENDPEPMVTTIGMSTTDPLTVTDLEDLGTAFHTALDDELVDEMTLIKVKSTEGNDGSPIITEANMALDFSNSGAPLLPNTAVLVRKNTGVGGRSQRGRMYIPGYRAESVFSYGVIDPTNVLSLQGAITDVFENFVGLGAPWGVPVLLHTTDAPDTTPTELVSLTVEARLATQRRRLRP